MSGKEEIAAKHLAAAAAPWTAAMHHKAAADAMQSEQVKEHAKATQKESSIACEKSTEAFDIFNGKSKQQFDLYRKRNAGNC